jgi:hypothetical protein
VDSSDRRSRTVSTKLSAAELDGLDELALQRGVTRSFLLKELVTAALDKRVLLPLPPPFRGSLRDFGASEAGKAALKRARSDAEAALHYAAAARKKGRTARKAGRTA